MEKAYDTAYSQAVTHPSTNAAQSCLTSVIGRELVFSTWYGRRHRLFVTEQGQFGTKAINLLTQPRPAPFLVSASLLPALGAETEQCHWVMDKKKNICWNSGWTKLSNAIGTLKKKKNETPFLLTAVKDLSSRQNKSFSQKDESQ